MLEPDALLHWLPWLALLILLAALAVLVFRPPPADAGGSGFALFTRRQRRRWPAWLLAALIVPLAAYLALRSGEPVPPAMPGDADVGPVVTEPVSGATPPTAMAATTTVIESPALPAEAPPDPGPDIRAAVEAWRVAWSGKDVDAYLGAYADDFAPPDGLSPDAWRAQRRERLGTPRRITIALDRFDIEPGGDRATVRFLQHYRSGSLDEKVIKRLGLRLTDQGWKITDETVESPGGP